MRTRRFRWMGSEGIDVILLRVEGSLATSVARCLLITRRWTDIRRRMIGRRRIVMVIVVAECRLRSFLLRLRHGYCVIKDEDCR